MEGALVCGISSEQDGSVSFAGLFCFLLCRTVQAKIRRGADFGLRVDARISV